MVVRVLASAADSSSAWDLRCDLREQMLSWVQEHHPTALPRVRVDREEGSGAKGLRELDWARG